MEFQLPLIVYDPDCPLCHRFKQGLEFLSKEMQFVSVNDARVFESFPQLDPEKCRQRVHLLTAEGEVVAGPQVVDQLLDTLPGVSKLAWLLDNEQGRKVKDYFYRKVEELREITKQRENCKECPR